MLNEDQYMERTPDLVARVRKMREAAEKEMNRFTHVADYDVRRVVGHGHGQKPAPVSSGTVTASTASERAKKPAAKPTSVQAELEFTPAPAERGDDREGA